jgi:hypothetical protein
MRKAKSSEVSTEIQVPEVLDPKERLFDLVCNLESAENLKKQCQEDLRALLSLPYREVRGTKKEQEIQTLESCIRDYEHEFESYKDKILTFVKDWRKSVVINA